MHTATPVGKIQWQTPEDIQAAYMEVEVAPCDIAAVSLTYTFDDFVTLADLSAGWGVSMDDLMNDRFPKTVNAVRAWVNALDQQN